jgi:hypothetical protein
MYRKYPINESFFDSIDSANKAYFLGLLYADGCNKTNSNTVDIQLSGSDKEILEKLTKLIYPYGRPLYIRKSRILNINDKIAFGKEAYVLSIHNKHISNTLSQCGMIKSKSLTLKFPTCISNNLYSHFIRGYFDGDGSISFTKKKQISITIIGSDIFCQQLKEILEMENIKSIICKAGHSIKVKSLCIHGNIVGRKFLHWIYDGAELYLQRKYLKSKEILNIIPPELPTTCSICDSPYYGCGYCKKHKYEFIGKFKRHERYLREKK